MSLKDQIDDVSAWMSTDDFAETITWNPRGVEADAEEITAIVELDNESGSDPFGVMVDQDHGSKIVRYGHLEIEASVPITARERGADRDSFRINGELWDAIRISGRDSALQTVLIRRIEGITTRQGK